ncbi:ATP-grasp domain-containing protein [Roseomonas sp. PWR1]|uniref:ATP-grasp domain-containing protein n=1 Tax=Roseomonas nitratireducens TaxID=2820810 RepID=A0ABS4AW11_9PROT|nr:ATP-grasp domain-containing protein [Neoroseomonas nitratireducens]MBP0464966.1 ATP-grasp domain-containing protein [Neoroseomonas nitratireducens]
MTRIHIIHENDAWMPPLRDAFAAIGAEHSEWFLDRGLLDLTRPPPEGVFYNRMSASSHTRGHTFAPEYAGAVIEWLERHGRLVVNGRRAIQLELSKVAQYEALAAFGIPTPPTVAVVGEENIPAAAERIGFPLILKHNRAGKGLGVQLVRSEAALKEAVARILADEDPHARPRDGIWLVQRYIATPEPFITRAEFVGGRFLYAVRVDTSEGFELCPADACAIPEGAACPAVAPGEKFRIIEGFQHAMIPRMERFLVANGVGVGAIEFATDAEGGIHAYDVNTNTNYNAEAERRAGVSAPLAVARHLAALLPRAARAA